MGPLHSSSTPLHSTPLPSTPPRSTPSSHCYHQHPSRANLTSHTPGDNNLRAHGIVWEGRSAHASTSGSYLLHLESLCASTSIGTAFHGRQLRRWRCSSGMWSPSSWGHLIVGPACRTGTYGSMPSSLKFLLAMTIGMWSSMMMLCSVAPRCKCCLHHAAACIAMH